ncbi:restriction endonuclease subunit S [Agarivorans gilvus]
MDGVNVDNAGAIIDQIDIWTSTVKTKSTTGRGSSKKLELYGVKKLRELILDLAVRGKLVPQDPNDEPASVLLERIAAEKVQLVKEKKIKKPRKYDSIDLNTVPFDIPVGWEWARIEELGHDLGQKKPDQMFTYVDVSAINKELGFIEEPNVLEASDAPSRARKLVKKGTVIYSTVRPYLLNIAVIDREFSPEPIASTAFAIIHPLNGVSSSYLYRYLRSPSFIEYVERVQTGVAYPAINDKQFFSGLIPVPPTEEQHRIVAKVDELMTLCDQLEQQTEASIEAHQVLVTTLLDTLTNSADAAELMQNWQMIAEHFDMLFTTEESIDQLKQTILQLAVMGKLVPQNSNDEPAAKLLESIAKEKAQLIKEKKIAKQKTLPPITEDEKPFELPSGWEWERLGNYSYVFAGNAFKSADFNNEAGTKVIKITNAGVYSFIETNDFLPFEFSEAYSQYQVLEGDLILALTRPYISSGLKVSICPSNYNKSLLNQRVAAIRTLDATGFTFLFLQSPVVLSHYKQRFGGSGLQPNLKMSDVTDLFVAVPPKNEQLNIVRKVHELFAICDQLRQRFRGSQEMQLELTNTIVEQAV